MLRSQPEHPTESLLLASCLFKLPDTLNNITAPTISGSNDYAINVVQNNTTVLDYDDNWNLLLYKEAFHIKRQSPSLRALRLIRIVRSPVEVLRMVGTMKIFCGRFNMKAVFWLGIMVLKQISRSRSSSQKSLCSSHILRFGLFSRFLWWFEYLWG